MRHLFRFSLAAALLLAAVPLCAQTAETGGALAADLELTAKLQGLQEVPAVSNFGKGTFTGLLHADLTQLDWTLDYEGVAGITQAHIHFGQQGVNGGIVIFFCSNLGNGPAGTPTCPDGSGTLSGSATAANVIAGAAGQGIAPGSFFEVQRAIRQGVAYANVHSATFPGGEIRGQIKIVP